MGILFTEDLETQIKAMQEGGDTAGAMALVMDRLAEATGGAAATQAETLAGKMEVLKGRLGEAGETIGMALLPALTELFDNVIAPAIPILEKLASVIGFVFSDILSGDIGVAVDDVREGLSGLVPQSVIDMLANFLLAVRDTRDFFVANWPAIQSTAETVFAAFQSAAAFVVDWMAANWPRIQATIETVLAAIQEVIETVVGAVRDFWIANGETIIANTQTAWNTIYTTVSTLITTTREIIETVLGAIQVFWAAHGDSIMTIVSAVFTQIQSTITTIITVIQAIIVAVLGAIQIFWGIWGETILSVVETLTGAIGSTIDAFAAALEGDWSAFGENLRAAWDQVWSAILQIMLTLIDQVLQIDWGQVGSDIIAGIAGGISAATHFVVEAAQAAVAAAVEAAKAFLGIESPSKVFAGIGSNLMQGMALGIRGGEGYARQAMAQAASSVVNNSGANTYNFYGVQAEMEYGYLRAVAGAT